MAASNTLECVLELRGRKVVGAFRNMLPSGRADLTRGTVTMVFDDGSGFTFNGNGAFWQETKEDIARAIKVLDKSLQDTRQMQEALLTAARHGP